MTTVRIGMDQWVVANQSAQTKLYTAGLSGCVAVCFRSGAQLGLTHVASDAGRVRPSNGEVIKAWGPYEHELDLILVVMRRVDPHLTASLVVSGATDQQKTPYTLIRGWLEREGVTVTGTLIDTGVMLEAGRDPVGNGALTMQQRTSGYVRLFEPAAHAAITNQGTLSQEANMPERANGGARAEDDD